MQPITRSVDPISFEILSHRLYQIAKEMGTTLERVGGTVNTTQQKDYMAALYRANGDILSAAESMAMHVACAGFAVKRIIERFENEGGINSDDVFLLNDPYLAAVHQSDVYMISPIHFQGRLVAWSATFVHVMDVGALSPGGNSPGATEIFHEGLRIPGVKLVEGGKLRRDLFDTIINMTRQPVMVGLDLKCEMAANHVAKSRMQEMYAQYGPELVDAVSSEMIRYAEVVLKRRISEIPDGTWTDKGTIEAGDSWDVCLKLDKTGDHLLFDFTGSSKQAKKGINLPYHATFGSCFAAVLFRLGYDLPKNHGAFQPIEVIAPKGTVVNAEYPAPVSMNTTSSAKIVRYVSNSVLMQMLATSAKWQREIMALDAGPRNVRHAGVNQHGRFYVSNLSQTALDGTGARSHCDGIDSGGGWMSAPNVEWVEMNFPILYLFRRHVKNGAGAGKFRGGAGAETAFTVHDAPEKKIKGVAYGVAGHKNSGQGIFGGYPGARSIVRLYEDTKIDQWMAENGCPDNLDDIGGKSRLLAYCEFEFKENDVLYTRQGNGGGYGDPLERDPQLALKDVIDGLLSKQDAETVYGVVIDEKLEQVDEAATSKLRAEIKQQRLRAGD